MSTKEDQLNNLLRQEQIKQLSSQQEENREQITSKSQFRKPIKNPFSDQSGDEDSDLQNHNNNNISGTPFPPKPPSLSKTAIQQAQQSMKWDKNEQIETQILAKLQGQGMKDKKIKQLASKYKALNIAYQKQKTLRKNLQTQLNSTIKNNEESNKSVLLKKQKSAEKTVSSCNNCQENDKKIMEFRLKNQNLKSQINKLNRLLARQLGEDFNVDAALSEENAWKGRQQKIEKLKSRVKQLEDKLNNNGINVSHMSGFTNAQVTHSAFNGTRTSALLAENKRKQLDNLKIQVDALKNQNQILQGKVKSLVSRKVILENEVKEMKADFQKKRELLIQKSNNDDKFIELLKNENEKLKKEEKVITKVIYKEENQNQVNQLKMQIEKLRKRLKAAENAKPNPQQETSPNVPKIQENEIKQQKRVSKDLNSIVNAPPRILSADKKKKMQEEYLKSNKYLSKMTSQEEEELYKNWKSAKQN